MAAAWLAPKLVAYTRDPSNQKWVDKRIRQFTAMDAEQEEPVMAAIEAEEGEEDSSGPEANSPSPSASSGTR